MNTSLSSISCVISFGNNTFHFVFFFLSHLQVWWSPCPSRECPEEAELELAVNQCVDYCLLREQSSDLFTESPDYFSSTKAPTTESSSTSTESSIYKDAQKMSTMFPSVVVSSAASITLGLNSKWKIKTKSRKKKIRKLF